MESASPTTLFLGLSAKQIFPLSGRGFLVCKEGDELSRRTMHTNRLPKQLVGRYDFATRLAQGSLVCQCSLESQHLGGRGGTIKVQRLALNYVGEGLL